MLGSRLEDDPIQGHPTYEALSFLSRGRHGFVVLARVRTTDQKVAIKFLERSFGATAKLVEREIINHACLEHPHVVQFLECFLTPRYLAIAMDYCGGGDLYSYVLARQGLAEDTARWLFQQLVLALDYCHKVHISSRDVKLENALLDSVEPGRRPLLKLCDFGYSINESESAAYTRVGTPGYTAPEVITEERYEAQPADIWSSGVLLYAMLFCRYPFEREADVGDPERHQSVLRRVLAVDYEWPQDKQISQECRDLLAKILVADPAHRITIAGIQDHPWFQVGMPGGLDVDQFNASLLSKMTEEERGARTDAIRRTVLEGLAAQLYTAYDEEVESELL